MAKVGIIGVGNMGAALVKGLSSLKQPTAIYVYDPEQSKVKTVQDANPQKISSLPDELSVAKQSDYLILAVKPYLITSIIQKIQPALDAQKCLISIAAGVSLDKIKQISQSSCSCVRIMPNTPTTIGKGVFALCFDDPELSSNQKEFIQNCFQQIGKTYVLKESLFDAFTALIGSGPAFVFLLLESFIQAGLTLGFSAEQSKEMVLALFEGSIALAQSSPKHVAQLKEMVASPGGTTIYGLNQMEALNLKTAIIQGILASYKRSQELG